VPDSFDPVDRRDRLLPFEMCRTNDEIEKN